MIIIDGRKIKKNILDRVKQEAENLSFKPVFCDIFVGDNPVSKQYVQMKAREAEAVGFRFQQANFAKFITTEELIKEIKYLNKIENMCGIIVQLPIPESIDRKAVLDSIDPKIDVDCLGTVASEKFYSGDFLNKKFGKKFGPPTALACLEILESLNLNLKNKKIVVIGRGELVGKPVAALFSLLGFSPTIVSSKTENKENIIKEADIIISGVGKGGLINGNMIKKGVVIIDAGTSEEKPKIFNDHQSFKSFAIPKIIGDVDIDSVADIASFVSPVPGGVGPVTVAVLLRNVLTVAKEI